MISPDENLLPRPPRFSTTDLSFNWRELEKYLFKLYTMLGVFSNGKFYNIPEEIRNLTTTSTVITYDSINNDISPYQEQLEQLMMYGDSNATVSARVETLEEELGEIMEQLDTLISKFDTLIENTDKISCLLVELRIANNLLNEGLNTGEDLDSLRVDEEKEI